MRFELIDQHAKPTAGCAGDLDLLECSRSRDPVIAISDQHGLYRLNSLGIQPIATLAPSAVLEWQTRHTLDRIFKRSGATAVVCRSDWSLHLAAQISGVSPERPKYTPESHVHTKDRASVRQALGLTDAHKLVVPLSNHPGDIDAMVLALFSAAMAIAETPIVLLLPGKAAFIRRARAFLANADRVLDVIATNTPTTAYASGADAIIWGPHTSDAHADYNAPRYISWARRFGVPVLCTERHISDSSGEGLPGKLHACAGTSAADIASPLLDIFNG